MKSERPENDDDASAGTAGEPPEAQGATESPEAAETDARADTEGAEAPESNAAEPKTPSDPAQTHEPALPEPENPSEPARAPATATHEPEKTPAAEATPEPAAPTATEASPESATPPEPAEPAAPATAPEPAATPTAETAPEADTVAAPGTAQEQPAAVPAAEAAPQPAAGATTEASESAAAASPVAETAPEAEVVASLSDGAGVVEAAAAGRPGARRSPALVVASVAAAVLLVGGGGAYLAAHTGSGGGSGAASGGSTPPPLALDGYSSGGSGGNGIAPGEPNPYGVTYKASGTLPGGPGSAAVYQPSGEVSKDRVAELAKALGIDGTPVSEGQVWKVGTDSDGSGGSLQVNRAAPGIWTYSRYAPGTDNCKSGLVCTQDPAAPAGDPVSVSAAEKAAAPVLKALGQDDAKLDASQVMGAQRVVNAAPEVGGLPTYGWSTGLTVSRQGEVVGGNGMLAAPAKGDTYPVLSAAKTLALMNAAPGSGHRMGIGGCASSVPLKDRLEQPCAASTPSASSAVIEKAVFGLASQSVAGRQALVPSWLFQVRGAADSYTVTYPAVDPAYLASSSTPSASASAAPKDVKVDGYTADGRDLTVAFTGGVCADYKVTADEGSEQVVVKVTATPWPDKICVMIAKQYHRTIHLDAPLDGRKVVGTDGRAVPKEKATTLNPQVG
ncbi:hypothetical protein [Streptomyces sp. NPDC048277]|uniref:hypothetical protein n=1 Tax=Streptomyces sp. NPDC048277 TaxID=3155027 RepID=UPI0033E97E7F